MAIHFSPRRAWAARGLVIVAIGAMGAVACSLITDLSPIAPKLDAAADAPIVAPPEGFSLVASPAHVVLDPGDAIDITVSIVRGKQFTGLVDVNVNDVGGLSGLTTTPAVLTFTANAPVTLHLDTAKDAKTPQDGNVTLLGVARADTSKTATAKFGVRIGSVLIDTTANVQVTVPAYASRLWIKAWGAGGGAGGNCSYQDANGSQLAYGSPGGAGGYVGALFSVNPADGPLTLVVGTPGPAPTNNCGTYSQCRGGGGGGYTAVQRGMTYLLVAGGGGGGGTGVVRGQNCDYGDQGQRGAAGGGADGELKQYGFGNPRPNVSATTGVGGATGGGNGTAGGALLGGNGGNASAGTSGAPGGGVGGVFTCCAQSGGAGGGGGGGGWYGGGGGGQLSFNSYNGGGGGGGYLDGGADASQAVGIANTPPATTDPDYRATTAVGGVAAAMPIAAGLGRVLIRMTKP